MRSETAPQDGGGGLARRICAVGLLAVALGYIEAALVVYLRHIIEPLRGRYHPEAATECLPLLSPEQLNAAARDVSSLLTVELIREPMPLLLLAAAAWGLRRPGRRGDMLGYFLLGFGVWDVFYYVFLKALLDWPASVGTWDILYLIPTAWVAPVWAPLAVSGGMIGLGLAVLLRRAPPDPPKLTRTLPGWLGVAAGIALVLASFLTRTPEAFARVPNRFDWPLFAAGWALSVGASIWLLRAPASSR